MKQSTISHDLWEAMCDSPDLGRLPMLSNGNGVCTILYCQDKALNYFKRLFRPLKKEEPERYYLSYWMAEVEERIHSDSVINRRFMALAFAYEMAISEGL